MGKQIKIWLIIAISLTLIGATIFTSVMMVLEWDFTKLSTVKYETNNYDIDEDFKNISIVTDTADIELISSEAAKSSVVCYESQKAKHTVTIDDDTLVIKLNNTKKWYENIGVNFSTPKITVCIPKQEYEEISVKVSTGDIKIENILANELNLSVSTGKTNITNTKCKNIVSSGSTGDITLANVLCEEKISVKRSTGDVKLVSSDAYELFIETDTGDVTGSLLSSKMFVAKTDTGSIDVPKITKGGKCEVITDTGDITFYELVLK